MLLAFFLGFFIGVGFTATRSLHVETTEKYFTNTAPDHAPVQAPKALDPAAKALAGKGLSVQ